MTIKVTQTVARYDVHKWRIAAPVTAKDLEDAVAAARQEMTRLKYPDGEDTEAITVSGNEHGITVHFTIKAEPETASRADAWDQGYRAGGLADETGTKANPYRRAFP